MGLGGHTSPHAPSARQQRGSWPVSAEGKVHLSFTLANAAAEYGQCYVWDFNAVARRWMAPLVQRLAPVAALTTDAQVPVCGL